MWSIMDVVVCLPLAPVTATTGVVCPRALCTREAYSISLITSRPWSRQVCTTGALSGMPGLLTTTVVSCQLLGWCPPISWAMPAASSSATPGPFPSPASLTNAHAPRDCANKAEPTPLSPAPSTRMGSVRFMGSDAEKRGQRTLRVTMVMTARSTPTIQNLAVILDSGMFCF